MKLRFMRKARAMLDFLALAGVAIFATPWNVSRLHAQDQTDDVLKTLRRGHPRLYVSDTELRRIWSIVREDPEVKRWYEDLESQAGKMLSQPLAEYKLVGPRLLRQSRAALTRISTLAFLYRLDHDPKKAARARAELLAVAAFPDWHPPHFLDTAEMTHAAALGYDWLFDTLSPEDRAAIRRAIVEKGLKPGLEGFKQKAWWTTTEFNWNQVCNGGLTLGALAIADEEPVLAREIINRSLSSIGIAMRSFAPDGGWGEGPGYWDYATAYNVYYLAGLESALGTDFGLARLPGFSDAGFFRIHSVGPSRLTFNFADAGADAGNSAQMFWLASKFHRPIYAQHERGMVDKYPSVFHLIWSPASSMGENAPEPPRDAVFRAVNVAFFRNAWSGSNAVYVGFKGGDNRTNHSHLDLGTFVLDALGQRWALDLGPDDYDLPDYWGKLRWTYYRLRTEGHNTLTLGRENQNADGKAPLMAFLSTPERAFAVADLTAGYAPKLTRALRGVALLHRGEVLVEDEIEAGKPEEVVWNFHTQALIDADGPRATLTLGAARLEARILSPDGARFEVIAANPPPPQAQQPDVHNLTVRLPGRTQKARIVVLLAPGGVTEMTKIEPLDNWIAAGSL